MGLTTVIPSANRDARGNSIPMKEREKFYRIRKLQRHSSHSRPGERSLPETLRSVDRVTALLGLPRPVREEAGFICKRALERGLLRGRSIEALVAAATYAACRITGVPRTLARDPADDGCPEEGDREDVQRPAPGTRTAGAASKPADYVRPLLLRARPEPERPGGGDADQSRRSRRRTRPRP